MPQSLADTKAVCSKFRDIVFVDVDQPLAELQKRQKVLRPSEGYDFLLVIDEMSIFPTAQTGVISVRIANK